MNESDAVVNSHSAEVNQSKGTLAGKYHYSRSAIKPNLKSYVYLCFETIYIVKRAI